MLKLFTNPKKFYEEHFYKTSGVMLGIVWAVVFILGLVINSAVGLAFGAQYWIQTALVSLFTSVVSVAVFGGAFAFSVKYIAAPEKKEFTLVRAFKLFLTGHLVSNIPSLLASIIIVPISFLASSSSFMNTDLSRLGVGDYDQVMSLAGQGVAFGAVGILAGCIALAGTIWGFIVLFIGTKKLTGADDGKSFLAVILPYVVALVMGAVMGFITSAVTAAALASTSVSWKF